MNNVQLVGRLTEDPEIRYLDCGKVLARFTLAVPRDYVSQGENKPKTDFIFCSTWGKQAEQIGNTLSKGMRIFITKGTLIVSKYTDKQDIHRLYPEVQVHQFYYMEPKNS